MVKHVNKEEFEKLIKQDKIVIVDNNSIENERKLEMSQK